MPGRSRPWWRHDTGARLPGASLATEEVPRRRRLGLRAVVLVAVCGALTYLSIETCRFGIDVPFWDEWLLLPLLSLQAEHGLTVSALLRPHNEHIPFFPRLLLISLAGFSGWNVWYECIANLVLGVATLVALLLLIRRDSRIRGTSRYVLYMVAGLTVLSLNQWENWMWGWQVEVFLNTAAVSWAMWFLSRSGDSLSLGCAALCGVVATFTFANGPLFWLATAPLVWIGWRHKTAAALAWLAVATGAVILYASQFQAGMLALAGGRALAPLATLETAIRLTGSALGGYSGATIAGAFGLMGFLAGAIVTTPALNTDPSPSCRRAWLALMTYGFLSIVLIALGRNLPPQGLMPSRYFTFGNLFFVAVAVLMVRRWPRVWWLAVVVPALAVTTGLQGRELYIGRKAVLTRSRASLYAPVDNPLIGRFFWDRQFVADSLPRLRGLRLSLYDCRQHSKQDWENAARVVMDHARPGDSIVTSSDWAATCLGAQMSARGSGITVVSAGESQAKLQQLMKERQPAFLVSGGDASSLAARAWIETHGFPLYRSPVGAMRLFYHPDRIAYLVNRLTPRELASDEAAFWQVGELVDARDQQFFVKGWSRWGEDGGGGRLMLERVAFLYVPVVRRAPRGLRLATDRSAVPANATLTVAVNDVPVQTLDLTDARRAWQLDLTATAAWKYGANIVRFELGSNAPGRPGPNLGDGVLPLRLTEVRFTAQPQ